MIKSPDDLMTEDQVYERYPKKFADRELREARQKGLIDFYDLRKGPHYSEEQLAAYLETQLKSKQCDNETLNDNSLSDPPGRPNGSSKSEGGGSQPRIAALS